MASVRSGLSHARTGYLYWLKVRIQSDSQFLAATGTTAGEYTTAVLGAHAGTETMNLVALAFLRLISAFHCVTTPSKLQNAIGICFIADM